jgi:hypothetical protein
MSSSKKRSVHRCVQPQRLARRTFLRGVAGGAAVSVGLPLLDIMLNENGTALADGGALPSRFGTFYWGGGVLHSAWVPSQTGMSWGLPYSLTPFEEASPDLRDYLTLVTGYSHKHVNPGHIPARGISLSSSHNTTYVEADVGAGYRRHEHPEASIDVLVSDAWQGQAPRNALHVAITQANPYFGNISWRAGGAKNDPSDSVAQIYNDLFSGNQGGGGGDPDLLNRMTALEESMLSAVMEDTTRLQNRLGVSDRQRLEQHLDGLRSLEQRLQFLEQFSCDGVVLPDDGSTMRQKAQAMSQLLAAALACDITRVFTYEWSTNQSEFVYSELGISGTHHNDVTHNMGSTQGQDDQREIIKLIMTALAGLADELWKLPEGGGNVLDNTLILGTSEHANANAHNYKDHPFVLVGKACGNIRAGMHHRHQGGDSNQDAPDVMLTAVRAAGVPLEQLGQTDSGFERWTRDTVSEIET